MDDLAGKLNELLNSPEGMARIQNLANMLGQNQQAAPSFVFHISPQIFNLSKEIAVNSLIVIM